MTTPRTIHTEVKGMRELRRLLLQLPERSQKKVLRAAARKGALILKNAAKANAPTGGYSGRALLTFRKGGVQARAIKLRDEIKITLRRGSTPQDVHFAVHSGKAYWGMFLEFGTWKQPATPWLRPALDEKGSAAVRAVGDALGKGIEKEALKLSVELRVPR